MSGGGAHAAGAPRARPAVRGAGASSAVRAARAALLPLLALAGACSLGEAGAGAIEPRGGVGAPGPAGGGAAEPGVGLLDPALDPLLSGSWLAEPEVRGLVETWADRWRGDGAALDRVLERMSEHRGAVEARLRSRGLPTALVYLPLAESRYDPDAVSRSGAVGLWQLMAPTARGLGLRVDGGRDERRDPARSTEAALDYLEWLLGRYESWPLALVAYNAGPARLDRLLERHVGADARGDAAYVSLLPHLHEQARHFVPRFLGALVMGEGWEGVWWADAGLAGR